MSTIYASKNSGSYSVMWLISKLLAPLKRAFPQGHLTPRTYLKVLILVFILFYTSGCLETQITQSDLTSTENRLLRANQRPLRIQMAFLGEPTTLGHQFLFVVIPFGSIAFENAHQFMESLTLRNLGLKGYQPVQDSEASLLELRFSNLSATGYDLLFVRQVACSMEISANLKNKDGELKRSATALGEYHSYVKFAFAPELTTCMEKAFQKASEELWGQLYL